MMRAGFIALPPACDLYIWTVIFAFYPPSPRIPETILPRGLSDRPPIRLGMTDSNLTTVQRRASPG